MLIFRSFSVLMLVLLYGCAGSPEQPRTPEKTVAPVKAPSSKSLAPKKQAKTAIDSDVMFMLMTAELAGQRGRYEIALEGYLEAAKRVKDPRFAERATMIALYMKDMDKTREAVNLWLAEDGNNQAARKIAVLSALASGDQKAAIEHLDVLYTLDPAGFEKSALELAATMPKDDKSVSMCDVVQVLSSRHPNSAAIYFVESVLAMQANKKELAEAALQRALAIQPDWDKALIFKAQIAALSGDMKEAVSVLKSASLKRPNDSKIKKLLAQLLIKAKDYRQASEVYQQLVKADPEDSDSRFALGLMYLQLDRDDDAEDIFSDLQELPQWQNQSRFYLGKLEEKREHWHKALRWFDKVEEGPVAFDAAISAVAVLVKDKQFGEANTRLDALAARFPKQKQRLLMVRAELLNQQKQYQQAFDLLSAAILEQPDEKELLYTRALLAERIGRLDVLESDLKKILVKNPSDAEALNALGYTLADKTDRYAEAEQYLLRALQMAPDEAVILDSYGWLQFKLGNMAKALDYLKRAYAKQKENEIAAHLAEVLWVMGKKDEARKLFDDAYGEAPEDEYLLEFQQRILNQAR